MSRLQKLPLMPTVAARRILLVPLNLNRSKAPTLQDKKLIKLKLTKLQRSVKVTKPENQVSILDQRL